MARGALILSTLPAGAGERRLAYTVLGISVAAFALAAPFSRSPLTPVPAFLPIVQSALILCDLITALLLLGQHRIARSPALLALASGYLFSACMAVAHLLSFPGLFAPGGLMGSGPQTTAWLYFLWHGGFPLFVLAYAQLPGSPGSSRPRRDETLVPSLWATAGTIALAVALFAMATAGHDSLPVIMLGDQDATRKLLVAACCWLLALAALAAVWKRHRPATVIDLWVMVGLCAWMFDVALAAVLNHARFDLGWYAGRTYGLLSATFVLAVLLLENGLLYARLAQSLENERRDRRLVEQRTEELLAANKELESFSYSVSHDLRAPLRAVDGYTRMLSEDYGEQLDDEARRLIGVIHQGTRRMDRLIDDLLAFSRLGRQPMRVKPVDLDALVRETVEEILAGSPERAIDFRVQELGCVEGDAALLRQVLSNLIGNAVKYSRGREPAVVEIGREAGTGAFYVKDNGAGFDMRHAGKLFGVFQRLHRASEFEGSGVGLAIVQRIVVRHQGRIWAESAKGEGATFRFTLAAESALPATGTGG